MISRRKLLSRMAGAIPATMLLSGQLRAADDPAMRGAGPSLAGAIAQRKNGVFFNSGVDTSQAVTILSTNANAYGLGKQTTLANLAGAGPYAFISFYIHALLDPINTSPLVVVKDPNIGDIFRIELLPAYETFSYFDTQRGTMQKTSVNVPRLNVFFGAMLRGSFVFTNYVTILPKFSAGLDMLFRIFYNRQNLRPGEIPLAVLHDIKGQPSSLTVQDTRFGVFGGGKGVPNGFIAPNWGATLDAPGQPGFQPDYHIGGDPSTPYPGYAYHGILDMPTLELGRFPPDITTSQTIMTNQYGLFPRPTFGGVGLANSQFNIPPAIHLSGGPGYGGFDYNQGIQRVDTLEIDTSFGTPDGFSRPALIPEGTSNFFSDE